jgi:hypothetical protein
MTGETQERWRKARLRMWLGARPVVSGGGPRRTREISGVRRRVR